MSLAVLSELSALSNKYQAILKTVCISCKLFVEN